MDRHGRYFQPASPETLNRLALSGGTVRVLVHAAARAHLTRECG